MQERMVLPSTSTVHAPHCPRPQPNRGPCSDKLSRKTYSSGVFGSASTTLDLPFTCSEIRAMVKFLSRRAGQNLCGLIGNSRIPRSTVLLFLVNIHPRAVRRKCHGSLVVTNFGFHQKE